jgi:hypothetical protein
MALSLRAGSMRAADEDRYQAMVLYKSSGEPQLNFHPSLGGSQHAAAAFVGSAVQ